MTRRSSFVAMFIMIVTLLFAACGSSSSAGPSATETRPIVTAPNATATRSTAPPTPTATATTDSTVVADADQQTPQPSPTPTSIPSTPTPLVLPTPRAIVPTSPPVRLRIPSIGIDADIERVGRNEQGQMGVPTDYSDVAWFEPGVSPGTPGNAVIAGHLDSATGPTVFYKLDNLNPGDEVFVLTEDGQELRFIVTAKESYPADDAPLDRIFGNAFNARLNLITCEGVFDRNSRQYDQRLVVYTQLATQ